MELGQQFRKN